MPRRIAMLIAVVLTLGSASTAAQETTTLLPGSWVRVNLPNATIVGELTAAQGESLTVRTKGRTGQRWRTRSVAFSDIERLEVRYWTGERLTLQGFGIGAAVGGLVGVGLGVASGDLSDPYATSVIGIFAAAGGSIGAIAGYLSKKYRWREVSLPESALQLQLVPAPSGIAALVTVRL